MKVFLEDSRGNYLLAVALNMSVQSAKKLASSLNAGFSELQFKELMTKGIVAKVEED